MAKQPPKMAWTIMFLMLFGMLGMFGYYTYTGTVVHVPGDTISRPSLQPFLRIEENSSGRNRTVVAYLSLQNSSPERLKLVDTQGMVPLYELQMRMRAEGSDVLEFVPSTAEQLAAKRVGASGNLAFNSENDAIVELLPGSALTRALNLSALFDLSRNGKYELTVVYNPESVIKGSKDVLAAAAHAQKLSCNISFELPVKKSDTKEAAGDKPKPVPPEKPAPAKNP